jgi:hypothetical protein
MIWQCNNKWQYLNSVALVCKRTIPTERPPLVSKYRPLRIEGAIIAVLWNNFQGNDNRLLFNLSKIYFCSSTCYKNVSVVGIETSYGLDDQGVGVRVLVRSRMSSSQIVQTGSEVHLTSYPVVTGGSFPVGKADGACTWPLTSN